MVFDQNEYKIVYACLFSCHQWFINTNFNIMSNITITLNDFCRSGLGIRKKKRPQESSSSADVTLKRIKGVKGPNSYNLFCAEFFNTGTCIRRKIYLIYMYSVIFLQHRYCHYFSFHSCFIHTYYMYMCSQLWLNAIFLNRI